VPARRVPCVSSGDQSGRRVQGPSTQRDEPGEYCGHQADLGGVLQLVRVGRRRRRHCGTAVVVTVVTVLFPVVEVTI